MIDTKHSSKKRGFAEFSPSVPTIVIAVFIASVLVAGVAYLFVPLRFTPPGSGEVPKFSDGTDVAEEQVTPVGRVVTEFYERAGELEEKPWEYYYTGRRKDLYEIAYACLRGTEDAGTLVTLLTYPDSEVRNMTVHALGDAQNVLGAEGHHALQRFWGTLGDDTDAVISTLVEALMSATVQGQEEGHISALIGSMGARASDAIPALVWASDHHRVPNMRIWAMSNASRIDPNSEAINRLYARRMMDPAPEVRREAAQHVMLRMLARLLGLE